MQSSPPRRPMLVIVSGAPASGKTTLATQLAARLDLPLLLRDGIKETLADALGASDVEASQRLGAAAYAVLYGVIGSLLAAGAGVVVESNFRHAGSESELLPFVAASDARLIHCEAATELILARYEARTGSPERHRVHMDAERTADLERDLQEGRFEPLRLDIPVLRVDTADGYRPPLERIVAFAGPAAG